MLIHWNVNVSLKDLSWYWFFIGFFISCTCSRQSRQVSWGLYLDIKGLSWYIIMKPLYKSFFEHLLHIPVWKGQTFLEAPHCILVFFLARKDEWNIFFHQNFMRYCKVNLRNRFWQFCISRNILIEQFLNHITSSWIGY